ncbi:hypothetical protein QN379_15025 [Glaciimonas sp. Gout2]|uniref:hypothetical protein n=1 Tax=unclassified Glaciimonas TaxID=2644401 RepID=UPI002B23741B|nr:MULTISPECIES: hypothetical protein [unclassified Glaciimonas]MEB0014423.1 hypothetical protein [Glaciimonas sp. Cout2]MEB0083317.1 hypothetical protein [Glaciimonas sp. Gout2]
MSAEIELTVFEVADDIWERAHQAGHQAVNQIVGGAQWIGGALKGEFKTKPTVGQIVVDAVVSMFPVAGEITAARDAIAISLRMADSDKEAKDIWNWVALVLCLLAVIPVLGGILKGVGRLLLQAAYDSAKLSHIGEQILAFLRKMGYGNTRVFFNTLDFTAYQAPVTSAYYVLMRRLRDTSIFTARELGAVLPAPVKSWLQALPPKLDKLQLLADKMIPQAFKELNALLNKVRSNLIEGNVFPITVGAGPIKIRTTEARIGEVSPIHIASKGHTAATRAHYKHKEGWPRLDGYKKEIDEVNTIYPNLYSFSSKASIEPVLLPAGKKVYLPRIIDTEEPRKTGNFWAEKIPVNGKAWRLDYAVKQDWSKNGAYLVLEHIPSADDMRKLGIHVDDSWEGIRAWRGKVAEQVDSQGAKATGILLPGGEIQLYIDFHDAYHKPLREYVEKHVPVKPTNWTDANIPHHVRPTAVFLAPNERSAKIVQEGYLLRGAATAGKQTNN